MRVRGGVVKLSFNLKITLAELGKYIIQDVLEKFLFPTILKRKETRSISFLQISAGCLIIKSTVSKF